MSKYASKNQVNKHLHATKSIKGPLIGGAFCEPCQKSKMELFAKNS